MELINQTICLTKQIGANGNMFGGEVMSLIDISAATYASEVCRYPTMVTLKITETLFRKPIKVGHLIKVYADVKRIGNTSITIKIEVRAHNVRTEKQEVVCETDITFVKIDEDGSPIPINSKVRDLYPHRLGNETKKEEKEIALLVKQIAEMKLEFADRLASTNSKYQKTINRISKRATFFMETNHKRNFQIKQLNEFLYFLLKENRITKEEISTHIPKLRVK